MKRILPYLLLLAPLFLQAADLDLPNPGFEEGLSLWIVDKSDGGKSTISAEAAHNGFQGLKVVDEDDQAGSCVTSKKIPVDPEKEYQLKFWAKVVQGTGLGVYLNFYSASGELLNTPALKNQILVGLPVKLADWKEFSLRATAPKNAAFVAVMIHSYGQAQIQAYLDDFSLSEVQ